MKTRINSPILGRRMTMAGAVALGGAALLDAGRSMARADAPPKLPGYQGAPRTELYNPALTTRIITTTQYKKAPPYVIGFSNAGLGDSWRVVALDELKQGAQDHKDVIKRLIITDAQHDDAKQVADVQDLASQGVDLLIVSANTEKALDPVVTRVMRQGTPVLMLDRRITSDHFVTFVNASDPMMGPPLGAVDRREAERQGQHCSAGRPRQVRARARIAWDQRRRSSASIPTSISWTRFIRTGARLRASR